MQHVIIHCLLFQLQDILMNAFDDLMDNDDNLNAINGTCHLSALLEVWYD
jgi:hypothetical protein